MRIIALPISLQRRQSPVVTSAINNWLVCRSTVHTSVVDWPCASRVSQSHWVGRGPLKVNVLLAKGHIPRTNISTDTDIFASILDDTSDMRDFLKLFLWQDERVSRLIHKE